MYSPVCAHIRWIYRTDYMYVYPDIHVHVVVHVHTCRSTYRLMSADDQIHVQLHNVHVHVHVISWARRGAACPPLLPLSSSSPSIPVLPSPRDSSKRGGGAMGVRRPGRPASVHPCLGPLCVDLLWLFLAVLEPIPSHAGCFCFVLINCDSICKRREA